MHLAESSTPEMENPKRTLVAGIVVRDGRALFVYNIKHGLRIEPTGGKVEEGETPEEALIREMCEETGMKIADLILIGVYQTSSPEGNFNVHTYICTTEGEPRTDLEPTKTGHIEWFNGDELVALAEYATGAQSDILVPNLRAAIGDILPWLS